jgi:hypothetical protein
MVHFRNDSNKEQKLLQICSLPAIYHEHIQPLFFISESLITSLNSVVDGFTYERAAINEWFLSGKFSSPMTNAQLTDMQLNPNTNLKTSICQFLYGENVP